MAQQVVHQPPVPGLEDLQRAGRRRGTGASRAGTTGSARPSPQRTGRQRDRLPRVGPAAAALSTLEPSHHAVRPPTIPEAPRARPHRPARIRAARDPASSPACCRAPAPTSTRCMATVRPLCEDVRIRGAQAVREITARLDGVDAEDFAVPQEALDRALAECDPTLRAALEEAITRVRKVHADQRRTDVTTEVVPGGTVTERWVPVRRVGPLRAGRAGAAAVQRGHERRPGADRRRRVDRRRLPAAARPRRAARPGRARRLRAAGHHRGLRRRRGAGRRRVRLRRRLLRAGRHGHRPGQRLRDRGQAAAARADRHRLRGRPHRGRDPGRRHRRPRARGRRPDQPGRARPAGRRGAGHRQRGARRRRPRAWCPVRSRPPSTPTASPPRSTAASPGSSWSTTSTPGCGSSTPTPPSTWRSRPATPARWRRGCATPARSSSAPWSPVSLGDYCAGSNHVLPTGGCARFSSGLSVQSFLRGIHVVEYDRAGARRRSPGTSTPSPAPRTCPAHAAAVRIRQRR